MVAKISIKDHEKYFIDGLCVIFGELVGVITVNQGNWLTNAIK